MQIKLIRGLLKGLSVAHADKHTILFERIKSVLALMAKQSQQAPTADGVTATPAGKQTDSAENKLLLSELSRLVLKP